MKYSIRKAQRGDGISVVKIFNHYIKNSFAAYTESPVGQYYFTQLWQLVGDLPFLVLETEDEQVVGYGLLTDHHSSPAFKGTVEISYFISPGHIQQGNGTRLLNELLLEAATQGLKTILASINSLNEGALIFHQKNGFTECGRFKQIGEKFDQTFDVIWMQRGVGDFE